MKRLQKLLTKKFLEEHYENKQLSSKEIANLIGCSSHLIVLYLHKFNINIRKQKLDKENNPNYKHGKYFMPHYCINCNKLIDKQGRSIRCKKCENLLFPKFKGRKHTDESLKIISKKSKAKFTKEFKNKIKLHYQGLKKKSNNGYTLIKDYNHPDRNKHNDILEHRLIMEKFLNRRLLKSEIVHHIDENRENNKIENLFLCKNRKHHSMIHVSFWKLLPKLLKSEIITFKNGEYLLNLKEDFGGHRKGVE